MNKYLARLKKQENEKESQDMTQPVLTQPTKPSFGSYVSKDTGVNTNKNITAICTAHREKELIRLITLVAEYHDFDKESYDEAVEVALTDPVNSLTCFSSLAREAGLL